MSSVWFDGVDQINTVGVDLTRAGFVAASRAQKIVTATAHQIEATAKAFAPVDTGALRASIGVDTPAGGGHPTAVIGPTVAYAPYVEWGTARMAPHAFMGPALDRHSPAFTEALSQVTGLFGRSAVGG